MRLALAAILLSSLSAARAPATARSTLVACAPGYPGTTEEAQPNMDALASAAARAARWPEGALAAVYEPSERSGLARLAGQDVGVALVPLPFYAKHRAALRLRPRVEVVNEGAGVGGETWALVAKRGRVTAASSLTGFAVASSAGYAPEFVRAVLAGWGRLPADARIAESSQVLSTLRRAASGDDVAVLLDGTQAAALPSLPFAGELEVVARSDPLPSGLVVTVGDRLPEARWRALESALLALPSTPDGSAALQGLRVARFAPLDPAALARIDRLLAGTRR
ncbi:MAG TPA: PhnD/SsuA/transferrin family substrate-binding protein [Anaeromyxobacter sp.]